MDGIGKYFNGRTAISRNVRFVIQDSYLVLLDEASFLTISKWSLNKIVKDESHSVVTVLCNSETGEKLEIVEGENLIPLPSKKFQLKGPPLLKLAVLFLSVSLVFTVVWKSLPVISGALAKRIPIETEKEWAKKLRLSPVNRFNVCTLTPEEKTSLSILTNTIYPAYPGEKADDLDIEIANSSMVNAFTFPGGKIVVMKGLLSASKTPEELAGVLAHEIEHVKKRHVSAMLIRSSFLTFIFHFLSGDFTSVFAVDPSTALSIASLSFDREMEAEADLGGLKRLQKRQINPGSFKELFNHTVKTSKFFSLFSNHPSDESRIEMIRQYEIKNGKKIMSKEQWKHLQAACTGSYDSKNVRIWSYKSPGHLTSDKKD